MSGDKVKMAINVFEKILKNVLAALYKPFWAAMLIAFLAMYLYLYCKQNKWKPVEVFKKSIELWVKSFKEDIKFRKIFLLTFYVAMILCRTMLYRDFWTNPLSDSMGGWGFKDAKGQLTTESIENIMLFIPFIMLVLWIFQKELLGENHRFINTVWVATSTVGVISLIIEFSQLLFHLGTFQISDLVYNTLGGTVGGVIYYIIYKIRHRNE